MVAAASLLVDNAVVFVLSGGDAFEGGGFLGEGIDAGDFGEEAFGLGHDFADFVLEFGDVFFVGFGVKAAVFEPGGAEGLGVGVGFLMQALDVGGGGDGGIGVGFLSGLAIGVVGGFAALEGGDGFAEPGVDFLEMLDGDAADGGHVGFEFDLEGFAGGVEGFLSSAVLRGFLLASSLVWAVL